MNDITFFYRIPTFNLIAAIFALSLSIFILIKFIKNAKEHDNNLYQELYSLMFIIFGFILFVSGIHSTIDFIKKKNSSRILIALAEGGIKIPRKKQGDMLTIDWDKVVEMIREDYETGGPRHRTHHEKLKIYYKVSISSLALTIVNLHYLDVSDLIFFSHVRKFYRGRILKEHEQGEFKILTDITEDHGLVWKDFDLAAQAN